MLIELLTGRGRGLLAVALTLAVAGTSAPLAAQSIQTIDPDKGINSDLTPPPSPDAPPLPPVAGYQDPGATAEAVPPAPAPASVPASDSEPAPNWPSPHTAAATAPAVASADQSPTYHEDDLIGAAEGVFGKGAKGVATMIKSILKKQGEPDAYIVGREAGGAIGVGLRYGSGTLYHKIEGTMPVYWTGPSIGFDAGANAGSTFVLVYNLYNTDDLYKRFPAGEGDAYVIGGLTASYMRRGDIVLIPIRVGAGLRLGVNVGYMKFSRKQRWLPF
jgi:hypothetical protein